MKKIALLLILALIGGMFAGCAGTTVVIGECTCPVGSHDSTPVVTDPVDLPDEGELKTGLAIIAIPTGENASNVEFDVTVVAVLVDENGVIHDCIIDSIGASVTFGANGTITSDVNAPILTKNEKGFDYGMSAVSNVGEWFQQAQALANYAIGRTAEELRNGAIDESGRAPEGSDLATSATIYLGGYVSAIEAAVNNARYLGAEVGDQLKLAAIPSLSASKDASAEAAGLVQLDCDVVALTVKDGVITSCYIDALQAKINFDATGTITSDLTAPLLTKNQLGSDYNMVTWGQAQYEWNEQAASFAAYVTGKTAGEVAGIAVTEGKPADADLSTSVTIKIDGFQALIAKALAE